MSLTFENDHLSRCRVCPSFLDLVGVHKSILLVKPTLKKILTLIHSMEFLSLEVVSYFRHYAISHGKRL